MRIQSCTGKQPTKPKESKNLYLYLKLKPQNPFEKVIDIPSNYVRKLSL